jgi:hypothetical protein
MDINLPLGSRWQDRTGEVVTVEDYNLDIVVLRGEHPRGQSWQFRVSRSDFPPFGTGRFFRVSG